MSLIFNSCLENKKTALTYPETKKTDVVDDYFGTKIKDPYRWLEDDMSDETAEWVKQENNITNNYLSKIPFRNTIKDKLTEIWDYPKEGAPFKKGNKYFYFKNNGLQNQSVLFYKIELDGKEVEILDPNKLSDNGTVALKNISISNDGKYLGYSISRGGSDWEEIFIRDIETKTDFTDNLKWVKFSEISWLNDGFYYNRYPAPKEGSELSGENTNSKVYFHKIGTSQEQDILIYEDTKNPEIGFSAEVSDSKKYLIISASVSTSGNAIYLLDIKTLKPILKFGENFEKDFGIVYDDGENLYVYTNNNAPNYKLLKINLKNEKWTDIVSESENVLNAITYKIDKFIGFYLKDARSEIKIFNKDGKYLSNLDNNAIGSFSGFSSEPTDTTCFYTFTSFTEAATIYQYDIINNKSTIYKKAAIKIDSDKYETEQVFYTSKDGTKIPMFIVHKKGIKLDGTNPTLLYGYGGFNISLTPNFSISRLLWLELGGVYAVANLRGGGEYGENWHKSGTLLQKQNVFDDFIAAAEYLINKKYTSPEKLAINGGSNGGLLVGAVTNQRPDLFAVAVTQVGVMDMLRYHKFTIGRYWATDYGTSEDSKEMFDYLLSYSPIHNIKENIEYPAILITTGDHDDRVVPAHSFKYAATLQEKYKANNPILIRIETEAGHGAGKPTMKSIEEISDIYSFILFNLNYSPKF